MLMYLVRRVTIGALVFLSVTGVCFFLFGLRGGSAVARQILGADAGAVEIQVKVEQLGLDKPLAVQYVEWLAGMFRGDLGRSFISSQEVTAIMSTRIPVTLSLIAVTMLLTVVFALLLGVLAATRGGLADRVLQVVSVAVMAVPGYWLALVLVIVFSLTLGIFPATGFVPISQSLTGWLSSIFLPSTSIALGAISGLAIWVRSSIIDLEKRDFVRTLRSRGISPRAIMYRHVLRNAAAPTIQMLGLMMIGLLGGAVIVERIFALPGIGTMALGAGQAGDVPVVLGAVTFMVVVVVVINLVVDIVLGLLNPKARVS